MYADPTTQTRTLSRSTATVLEGLFGAVSQAVTELAREWRIRRDLGRVAEFDDSMLHDIGLARGEIESALRHGRSFRSGQTPKAD